MTAVGFGLAGELLDQSPGDRWRQQRITLSDDPDRGDELLGRRVLQEVAAGAGAQGGVHVLVEIERGEHEHLGVAVVARRDQPSGLDAVQDRHPDVHEHDVGTGPLAELDAEPTVLGITDDFDVGLRVEDHAEAVAHQRLVVDDRDSDGHVSPASHGPAARCSTVGASLSTIAIGRTARTA